MCINMLIQFNSKTEGKTNLFFIQKIDVSIVKPFLYAIEEKKANKLTSKLCILREYDVIENAIEMHSMANETVCVDFLQRVDGCSNRITVVWLMKHVFVFVCMLRSQLTYGDIDALICCVRVQIECI